ncbi:MAB_1171c family putative transporter [Streptomyces sp. NPDC048751]|uniref:MAB_1171c family putative transporter n=1 Tax=Streptomyces sp. NPDC048751 TaxID=3365591 RepID=UPI003719E4C2
MTAIRPYEVVLLVPMWSLTVHSARRALRSRAVPESAPARLLAGVIALVTLSVTVGVPAVRRVIDTVTGVPSITNVISHLLGMSAITCLTAFVRRTSAATGAAHRGRTRDWLPLPVVAAALCTAFFLAPRPSGEQYLLTDHSAAHTAYWAIYIGYVLWGVAAIGVMCLRHHKQAPPGPLRTSLNLIGAGAVTAIVYALHRCAYLALRDSGIPLFDDAVVVPTTQVLLTGALLLSSSGIAWPALTDRWRAYADRRRLRRLEPLWRMLTDAVPEVVLPLPAQLRADPELMLYRYTIESSDAILALTPFRSPTVETAAREQLAAHGVTGPRLAAATEAVVLRCAIARASMTQTAMPPTKAPEPSSDSTRHSGDPLEWLELLAAHCRHPLVRSVSAALTVPAND